MRAFSVSSRPKEGNSAVNRDRHAKISDLPGWPCPPRVRDIPTTPDSWGWVSVGEDNGLEPVMVDELGYLWVNASVVPRYVLPNDSRASPGAIVFWSDGGVGLYIHPKSYKSVPNGSRLDFTPDEWLPVAEVAAKLPGWVTR